MRRLGVADHAAALAVLRQAFERSAQSRFEHRLHCMLLVGAGWSCAQVAEMFGDDARTIQRWAGKWLRSGPEGLRELSSPGRPAKLTTAQAAEVGALLGRSPRLAGHPAETWRSDLLRNEIASRFGVALSQRHCQRLLRLLSPQPSSPLPPAP